MRQGSMKFLMGAAVGAAGGFVLGSVVATPTARSAGQSILGGLDLSARYIGRSVVASVDGLGAALESAYTRLRSQRGREAYLEHQIEELRRQITHLEQRME